MIHAVLLIASVLQGQAQPIPPLPTGSSPEFQKLCISIESSLQKGDFKQAALDAVKLPKKQVTVSWNDQAVPEDFKQVFTDFRDIAMSLWNSTIPGLSIKLGPSPDVKFDFAKQLPNGEKGTPSASTFTRTESGGANLTIGLNRGRPIIPISKELMYVEMTYAFGKYFGLAESPIVGSAMFRTDEYQRSIDRVTRPELVTAAQCLNIADKLRKAVAAKQKVEVQIPEQVLEKDDFDLGTVEQGAPLSFKIKIHNKGKGPLSFRLQPDCGCFTYPRPGVIGAETTEDLAIDIRTIDFVGQHHKRLTLFTNDPEHPIQVLPVHFKVRPAYRMFRPEGEVIILPENGGAYDVFLYFAPGLKAKPLKAEMMGITGTVTMSPWQGVVSDPLMGEPAMPRKGYKLHVKIGGGIPPGRPSGTIEVTTDDATFRTMRYSLYAQKGIVALPDNMYLGQTSEPQDLVTIVSRPGQPYDITGITSTCPNLTGTFKMVKDRSEYTIRVHYDGKAPKGDFLGVVQVKTNDPKQPVVEIVVSGLVR